MDISTITAFSVGFIVLVGVTAWIVITMAELNSRLNAVTYVAARDIAHLLERIEVLERELDSEDYSSYDETGSIFYIPQGVTDEERQ